jgi:hypothetical protein
MLDVTAIADHLVHLFREGLPWLGQTIKGAIATQAVREAWEQVKAKFFSPGAKEALDKVQAQPEKDRNWDILKLQLLDALETDEKFRDQMSRFVEQAGQVTTTQQTAIGNDNKQALLQHSEGSVIIQSGSGGIK